jgi:AraC family transcriptional regulator
MPEYDAHLLLHTGTITAWDVLCQGSCRGKAAEEWTPGVRLVFPYRGVYVHSVGSREHVAEPNQAIVVGEDQPYRVSHPVPGGDATLTVGMDPATVLELAPRELRGRGIAHVTERAALRIDAGTQLLAAGLRQRLSRGAVDPMEAETLTLRLVRRTLGTGGTPGAGRAGGGPGRLAHQVKLLLSADPWRRWSLSEVAAEVSVSPVYLTDAFRRAEGVPLYRYQRRLRLALALTRLADSDNLADLAVRLGFHSHSHFSAAFRAEFGQTPSEFRGSVLDRDARVAADPGVHPGPAPFISRAVPDTPDVPTA